MTRGKGGTGGQKEKEGEKKKAHASMFPATPREKRKKDNVPEPTDRRRPSERN